MHLERPFPGLGHRQGAPCRHGHRPEPVGCASLRPRTVRGDRPPAQAPHSVFAAGKRGPRCSRRTDPPPTPSAPEAGAHRRPHGNGRPRKQIPAGQLVPRTRSRPSAWGSAPASVPERARAPRGQTRPGPGGLGRLARWSRAQTRPPRRPHPRPRPAPRAREGRRPASVDSGTGRARPHQDGLVLLRDAALLLAAEQVAHRAGRAPAAAAESVAPSPVGRVAAPPPTAAARGQRRGATAPPAAPAGDCRCVPSGADPGGGALPVTRAHGRHSHRVGGRGRAGAGVEGARPAPPPPGGTGRRPAACSSHWQVRVRGRWRSHGLGAWGTSLPSPPLGRPSPTRSGV